MRLAKLLWRLKSLCNNCKNAFLKRIFIQIYNSLLDHKGSFIGHNSIFKQMPVFPHGINSIFISGGTKIGTNCVIFQQVTIGSNTLPDSNRIGSPTIGDNCYISAGAKIVGNVKVGNNVRIGANCVVFQDVPDNSVVVLPAPRIIEKDGELNNKFYQIKNGKLGYVRDGEWKEETNAEVMQKLII